VGGDIPRCSSYGSKEFGWSSLDDVDIGFAGSTPKLDTVGPYRLDHCFVYEEFILEGEAGFFANEPVELGSFVVHLFALPEYVWSPGEFAVQGHPEVCALIETYR
jgi:hypothetical protein